MDRKIIQREKLDLAFALRSILREIAQHGRNPERLQAAEELEEAINDGLARDSDDDPAVVDRLVRTA